MKTLIKHLRDDFRKPFATIVAVDKDFIGVSICNPKDNFNRQRGIQIAMNRAFVKMPPEFEDDFPNRWVYKNKEFKKVGEIILTELENMKVRSRKYYWQ